MESLQVEFCCLLARLGSQLTRADVQGLPHHFEELRLNSSDESFHALFSLEAMGHIDCYSPDKLLDTLADIGRGDLARDIMEYKESALYQKVTTEMKVEPEPRQAVTKEKPGPQLATKLLSGAEIHERQRRKDRTGDPQGEKGPEAGPLPEVEGTSNPNRTRWWNTFSEALMQVEQLKKQMNTLYEDIQANALPHREERMRTLRHRDIQTLMAMEPLDDSWQEEDRMVMEALHLILLGQAKVRSTGNKLKKAAFALGLQTQEEQLGPSPDVGLPRDRSALPHALAAGAIHPALPQASCREVPPTSSSEKPMTGCSAEGHGQLLDTDEVDTATPRTLSSPPLGASPTKKSQQDNDNELYKFTSARTPIAAKDRPKMPHPKDISAHWMAGRRRVLKNRMQRASLPPRSSGASCTPGFQGNTGAEDKPDTIRTSSPLHYSAVFSGSHPGVQFFGEPIREEGITWRGATIQSPTTGICVTIPEHSLGSDEGTIDFLIHPCFSGPFELPPGYESASPAYLIQPSRKVTFLKHVTIQIHHYTSLTSKADCEEMDFFSANPTPQYRNDSPVYTFKDIRKCKGTFGTKSQVGEIQLKHFCFIKIGRKKRSKKKHHEGNHTLYSARLYRNPSQDISTASAVFCVCLCHPLYIRCCDQRIPAGYTGMSQRAETKSELTAKMIEEEIMLSASHPKGWCVTFDKEPTTIQKRDIDLPEFLKVAVDDLPDYPPRFLIHVEKKTPEELIANPPKLLIHGLDVKDCSFKLPTSSTRKLSSGAFPVTVKKPNKAESSLSHHDILVQLRDLNREWDSLGMALGLEHREIQEIQLNHSGDVRRCLGRVIEEWLKWKGKEVSWKTMYEALRDPLVSRPDIAGEIKQRYLEPS